MKTLSEQPAAAEPRQNGRAAHVIMVNVCVSKCLKIASKTTRCRKVLYQGQMFKFDDNPRIRLLAVSKRQLTAVRIVESVVTH
jgi:hypothetical protein